MNSYLERAARSKIGSSGRKSEKRLAKEMGGRLRPASGAMAGVKGDIARGDVLLEAKSTTRDSLGVKYEWLAKISREAVAENKTPALAVSFVDTSGKAFPHGDWVMVPRRVFEEHLS